MNVSYLDRPEIAAVLEKLVSGTSHILGNNFIGAWLQGSMATGDFDEHSDIDFVIGVERELSKDELEFLQEFHLRLYAHDSPWAKHLEGSYFPREVLQDYRLSGSEIWYLDRGRRSLERSAHDNTVVVKWILRERGVVLSGPDPATLIVPIPKSVLRRDVFSTFADWAKEIAKHPDQIDSRFYQSFAVLSYCRMLRDLEAGEIGSKRAGAEWVKANSDSKWHDLIDRAWDGRPDPALAVTQPADPEDLRRTLEFIETILQRAQVLMEEFEQETSEIRGAA